MFSDNDVDDDDDDYRQSYERWLQRRTTLIGPKPIANSIIIYKKNIKIWTKNGKIKMRRTYRNPLFDANQRLLIK